MHIPFRLAAILLQSRFAEISRREKSALAMRCIQLPENGERDLVSAADDSAEFAAELAVGAAAPVIWLNGFGDLLTNFSIGKFTRRLQDAGRTVFLETDGMLLRRRVHEFRPDARLYLTIRLHGMAGVHDLRMRRDGAFVLAMEGIRAAQLSGFLICAHVPMDGETEIDEVRLLLEHLRKMDVDGVVVTTTNVEAEAADALRKKVAAARKLIGNSWWAGFSLLAESALDGATRQDFVGAQHPDKVGTGAAPQAPSNAGARISQDAAVSSEEVAVQ